MSICSYCHHRIKHNGFNVGEWWNNESDMIKVCSTKCKDKLWKMVQDGTWMDHKPEAIFGKKKRNPSPSFDKPSMREKGPKSVPDKQFSGDLGKFMT